MIDNNNIITETYQNHNNHECLNTDTPIMVQDPSSVLLEISRHGKIYQTNFFKSIFNNEVFTLDYFNKYSWKREGCSIIYSDISHINLNEKRILKCLNLTTIPKEHRRNVYISFIITHIPFYSIGLP